MPGLDYSELDVVCDNESGKIYIVDARTVHVGPALSMISSDDTVLIMERLFRAFSFPTSRIVHDHNLSQLVEC